MEFNVISSRLSSECLLSQWGWVREERPALSLTFSFSDPYMWWQDLRSQNTAERRKRKGGVGQRVLQSLLWPGTVTPATLLETCGLKDVNYLLETTGIQEVSGGKLRLRSLRCQSQCPEHHITAPSCLFSYIGIKSPSPATFWDLSPIPPPLTIL